MSVVMPPAGAKTLGRFQLRRLLGRGAQASVWLAYDPRLEREVAVKLLATDSDTGELSEWLDEARAVSRLSHPNIVPVFEADQNQGRPYLVFEFVDGVTLAEALRKPPPPSPRAAVETMLGIVEAVAVAHDEGIVHRDLKPSNVLIGKDGRARVMDFGIAARVSSGSDGSIVGTPGYISPEAARGQSPLPQMDVFAAGLMLAEMLCGSPLIRDRDIFAALDRVQHQDLTLPPNVIVDDALRAIVQRALARDLSLRYEDGSALRVALAGWLHGVAAPQATAAAATPGHGTVDFLLRRMRHKADFPALGSSVARIQRAASSESESLASLSTEILRDVALTNKLLRMVNSAHFGHTGGGNVTTVSRAAALIGFAGVRNMALSLVLLEHMQDKSHASQMREEFLRALMAGTLAAGLAMLAREGEEVFIGAMFQNLGRMLTEYYFPEEARQIRKQARDAAVPALEAAAAQVLGIGFEELGVGIARAWGLPESLQKCMRVPDGDPPGSAVERGIERMRWLGRAANTLADALLLADPAERAGCLELHANRFAATLGVSARDILSAASAAQVKLAEFAHTMGVRIGPTSPARRLLPSVAAQDVVAAPDAPTVALDGRPSVPPVPGIVSDRLTAGIQSVASSLAGDDFKLNEVLRLVLETMMAALGARRIVFCLRDPHTDTLTGRFGLGADADRVSKSFKVPLAVAAKGVDLFGAICRKGADTLIADATTGSIGSRLPTWYREQVNAPWFLLLPLTMRNAPFGLIYADAGRPNAITLDEKELSLLRTLRNQVVMAFRHADRG